MDYKQIKTDLSVWMIIVSKGHLHIAAMFNHPISKQDLASCNYKPKIYISSYPPTDDNIFIDGGYYDEIHQRAVISWTHAGSYIFTEKELSLNIKIGVQHHYVPVNTQKLLSRFYISNMVERPKMKLCSICKENENNTIVSHCDSKINHVMCNSCASYGHECLYCGRDINNFFKMDLLHLKQKWAQDIELDDEVDNDEENYYDPESDLEVDI